MTLLLLAFVSLLTFQLHYHGIHEVLSRFQEHQLSYARHLSNEIQFFIQSRSRGLRALSSLRSVREGDLRRQRLDIEAYAHQIEKVYVSAITRYDQRGTVVASTDADTIGLVLKNSPFFLWAQKPENRGNVQLSLLLPASPSPFFILGIPLYQEIPGHGSKSEEEFAGALAFTLDMKQFLANQLASSSPRVNLDQVWIVDKDGTLLFQGQHPEMVFRNIYQQEGSCFQCHLSFGYVQEILTKRQGTADYEIKNHPKKIAAFAPMEYENVSWVIVVNNPYNEVTGFIKTSLHEHLVLFGTVVLALAFGSALIVRNERRKIEAEEEVARWQERVAERRRAEQDLQRERDKLQGILNSMTDGVCILNQQNEILYSNPVIEKELGHIRARKCHDYFHDLPTVCSWCKNAEVFAGKTVRWEWSSVKTGKTFDLFGTPITGPDGSLCKLQLIRDITDRKRAERALRQSEKRYRMLVETMSDGLGVQDEQGVWTYVNSRFSEMLGYSREEMVGRSVIDFLSETDQMIYKGEVARRRRGERESYEIPWLKKDNKKVFTLVSPNPILDERGRYKGSFAVVTSIAERKKTEEALKQSARQLRYLSSQLLTAQETERKRISRELHDELGQALMVMKLRFNFIEKNLHKDQTDLKRECEQGLQYIDQVIENVRRLSRDLSPSILEDFGLSATLRWLINNFAKSHRIKVDLEMIALDSLLPQDSHVIVYRIIQEALTNAGKHSAASRVSIAISKENGRVLLVVEDDGTGFDADEVISGNPAEKGLGLETMKGRAQMIGGVLDIKSQPGRGTRLTLSIPIG